MFTLPLLNRRLLALRLSLRVFERDVLALVSFDDRSYVGWLENTDGWKRVSRLHVRKDWRTDIRGKECSRSIRGRRLDLPISA